ncbi:hypothetical protein IWT25_02075 [Secundilactobacillus pentosiphilus]|uniref:Uncharacterized protein n=1 Tax=Secundilactobacillus pentosiphilus TaxID=1714682 RepID=A0A1Z5IYW4_9LACO|nr:hypothetical protein IWT25_02075 [Secundilactobacillus pentosiphilus]
MLVFNELGDIDVIKRFKNYIIIGLVAVIALIGMSAISQSASAHSKYTTTPTSLRGKWVSKTQYVVISKYEFSVSSYKHGKKSNDTWSVSGKRKTSSGYRLSVSKKSKSGYYRLGIAKGESGWPLKRTHHKGKTALVTYGWNPMTHKAIHSYFYKK